MKTKVYSDFSDLVNELLALRVNILKRLLVQAEFLRELEVVNFATDWAAKGRRVHLLDLPQLFSREIHLVLVDHLVERADAYGALLLLVCLR